MWRVRSECYEYFASNRQHRVGESQKQCHRYVVEINYKLNGIEFGFGLENFRFFVQLMNVMKGQ